MGSVAKVIDEKYTYADYLAWDDDKRWEIIEGEPILMSPAPNRIHQKISAELLRQFANFLQGKKCQVYAAPFDVRFPSGNEIDDKIETVVQPDLSVICDRKKLDHAGCRGAPDLIIEILSISNAKHDHIRKLHLYEKHKVKQYWIIDPEEKILWVRQIKSGKYLSPQVYSEKDRVEVSILPDLTIYLGLVFAED